MTDAEIIKFLFPYLLKITLGLVIFQVIAVVLHLYHLNRCKVYLYDLTSVLVSMARRYENNEEIKDIDKIIT